MNSVVIAITANGSIVEHALIDSNWFPRTTATISCFDDSTIVDS